MSGVQKVSLDELENLDPSDYERVVVCKCAGEFTVELNKIGIRVHFVPALERTISPIQDIKAYIDLRKFFTTERPDIVHSHSSKTGILGRFAASAARVPTIVHTVHGFAFQSETRRSIKAIYIFLERIAAKLTDKIIVLNETDATIARNIIGVPDDRIVLLENGVDARKYAPAEQSLRQRVRQLEFGVEEREHVVIGMVGRLWFQKNPQCFVRAANKVISRRDNVSFFMIGDGEYKSELEHMINKFGTGSRIRIMGWRKDVSLLLKGIDIMVLPSRWEGLPLAILEAMSTAVPVIASDIPGNNHIILDGINGRLFALDDDEALAKTIIDLIDNPNKRRQLSDQARSSIIDKYQLTIRMEKIKAIYNSSVNQ